jgi:NAD(P)-dependent dehydrogenase (short-subunit alcohol dehydrogenase family)
MVVNRVEGWLSTSLCSALKTRRVFVFHGLLFRIGLELRSGRGGNSIRIESAIGRRIDALERVRRHFDTNVLRMILMIQEVLAHLGSHGGRIINIGSGRERQPNAGFSHLLRHEGRRGYLPDQ